jgi:hypothetical protein
MFDIQHCFICRPSDSTVSEDAGTVATTALAVRHSNHSARSHTLSKSYPRRFSCLSPPLSLRVRNPSLPNLMLWFLRWKKTLPAPPLNQSAGRCQTGCALPAPVSSFFEVQRKGCDFSRPLFLCPYVCEN